MLTNNRLPDGMASWNSADARSHSIMYRGDRDSIDKMSIRVHDIAAKMARTYNEELNRENLPAMYVPAVVQLLLAGFREALDDDDWSFLANHIREELEREDDPYADSLFT